jgi:starch synthase
VGGLADTVIHASPAAMAAGVATGISFHPTDAVAFGQAMRRLVQLYGDVAAWEQVQRNAMRHPVGWAASAAAYAALYDGLRA